MSHRPEQHRAGLTGGAEAVGHSPSSDSLKDVTQHTQLPETLVRSTEKWPSQPNQKIITGSFWLHMALLRSVILCFQKKSTRARVNSNIRVRALEMVEKIIQKGNKNTCSMELRGQTNIQGGRKPLI